MKSGAVKKFDYEYERGGVASVFVAFESLSGKRLVRVYRRRTKADYCRFAQQLSNEWSLAEIIALVQDNLKRALRCRRFTRTCRPASPYALMKRLEFHYTLKKGSSLNMAELELSAISRQCWHNVWHGTLLTQKL